MAWGGIPIIKLGSACVTRIAIFPVGLVCSIMALSTAAITEDKIHTWDCTMSDTHL